MRASSDLGLMTPRVYLFHNRKKCKRFLERNFNTKVKFLDCSGQMFYKDGIAVILMEHHGKETTELALLTHEAYHAAVAHMDWLGEDDFGEETMACLVQTISNNLFVAHQKWKTGKGLIN